ncbi:hypothetical protein D3C80_1057480 [compost metagenome]
MLEQHQPLPGRQQNQQADQQPAGGTGPQLAAARVGKHQPGGQPPPDHRSTQHPGRQLRKDVQQHQRSGDDHGIGDAQRLGHEPGQARPLPGAEGHHEADEQGEIPTVEQEEATQRDRQQDQRSNDALFKH